ncbi:MAG TPA: right-handed parallel beta-helix repeat-containing protein [Pyrinomonadaceae bacterium]|jgi:hypothetical protein
MNKLRFALNTLAVLVFALACSSLTHAQASRTWVSGVGDDFNPCSRTAPCKTFAGAISKTAEGGEIDALDPGGFGALTITKAITVDGTNGQGFGGIVVTGTSGVTVNLTGGTFLATAVVKIRNLSINGLNQTTSSGVSGIRWINTNGKAVHVENCHITGFNTHGIDVNRAATGELYVSDTIITNCTNTGISVATSAGVIFASVDNVQVQNCAVGVSGGSNSRITLTDSVVSRNITGSAIGVVANSGAEVLVSNTQISNNGTGVQANAGGTIRASDNVVTVNSTGFFNNGGTFRTFQNNRLDGNTTNVSGVLTNVVPANT